MRTIVAEHPLVQHKITRLRDERTETPEFRRLADELVTLLAYEATRGLRTERITVRTPLEPAEGLQLAWPPPLIIPILRAGMGMLDGMLRLLPTAEVGFLGMIRDEKTLEVSIYADRMPADVTGRQVFVVDPMLATGGSLAEALEVLVARGGRDITAITLLSTPEGLAHLERATDDMGIDLLLVTGALDRGLDSQGFIVPGLGDAGDRLFGAIET